MTRIRQWWHWLAWRSQRAFQSAFTIRDKHYFVIDGALYLLVTEGSRNPVDWYWVMVTEL